MSNVDPPVSWEEQQYLDMKHERDTIRDERDRLKAVLELVGEQEFLDTLAMALHHEHCLTDASYAEHFVKHPNEIDTAWAADGRNRALWYGRARITIRVMLAQIKAALTPAGGGQEHD